MVARRMVGAMVIACGLWGCGSAVEVEESRTLGTQVAGLSSPNGRNLNGRNLNGRNLNSTELGQMLVSVRFAGAERADAGAPALSDTWLDGSVLHGATSQGVVSGMDFLGARFVGELGSGDTVPLRIDDIQPATGASADVWVYRVSYYAADEGAWKPACQAADGSALGAIALTGRWDYRQGVAGGGAKIEDAQAFTFACEGAALAKCVRFGYRPWAGSVNGQSLGELHQACTRMVRADFCGDGTSYTTDGNWVNLYDAAGVQQDTESWSLEAEWDAAGARCRSQTTRAGTQAVACASGTVVPTCGPSSSFETGGTLLMSEVPVAP
ncbi:ADYC domain-containing protein [Myxococcus sp. MISCRS1]|uniref:ADYC domain-containing protein n=1 Tax=Myxococcus TaxID=32 RepID=UPI001CBE0210|nr:MULTISPECIES: ADYC domain-containing protein [unclassified Myxococcus]MBZ4395549.1 hypothetical protein [Myxococcus sp. AS-1-15]MCY0999097.1 ADYC domain-containing protein [Myxococcus sp. MISCRS1]